MKKKIISLLIFIICALLCYSDLGLEANNNSISSDDGALEKEFVLGAKYGSPPPDGHIPISMVTKANIPGSVATMAGIGTSVSTITAVTSPSVTTTSTADSHSTNGTIAPLVKTEPPEQPDLTTLTDFPGFGFKFGLPDLMMQQILPVSLTSSSGTSGSDTHPATTSLAAMLANHSSVVGSTLGLPVSSEQGVITPSPLAAGSAAASLAMLNAAATAAMSAIPSSLSQPTIPVSGSSKTCRGNSPLPTVSDILSTVPTSATVDSTS